MAQAQRGISRFLIFGKWLTFGFRSEWEDKQAKEENRAHPTAGVSESLEFLVGRGCASREPGGEMALNEWAAGSEEASDVVAEAGAGAAEIDGKKFRKIDGKPGEEGELAHAHDGDHPEDVGAPVEELENGDGADHGADITSSKNGFAAVTAGEFGEKNHSDD